MSEQQVPMKKLEKFLQENGHTPNFTSSNICYHPVGRKACVLESGHEGEHASEEQVLPTLQHRMNCASWFNQQGHEVNGEDCTCGLHYRIQLQTEQTMHLAWRKRAEEAEASLAQSEAERERLQGEISRRDENRTRAEIWSDWRCKKDGVHLAHDIDKDRIEKIAGLLDETEKLQIELARERELNRWRDCKQELPHFGERVLAYSPANKHQGRRYFVTSLHVYSGKKDMIWLDEDINEWATHWMPLPKPPALYETLLAPPTDPKPNAEEEQREKQ